MKHLIAVAVPGPVDATHKKLLRLPNLPGWRNKPITRTLAKTLRAKVLLINDADAAGLGEALRGAGRGHDRVGYLTISTGIGGALILKCAARTVLNQQRTVLTAEPGHQLLVPGGNKCGCGRHGCFEAYGSGTAFYKKYKILPEHCKDKKIWAKHAQILGWGITNAIRLWSPDIMVIGGGMSRAGLLLFKPLRTYVHTHLAPAKPPPLVPAKLGDNAGLYGCLELINSPSSTTR